MSNASRALKANRSSNIDSGSPSHTNSIQHHDQQCMVIHNDSNIYIGDDIGQKVGIQGEDNIAIGNEVMSHTLNLGSNNIGIGAGTLSMNMANNNIALGYKCLTQYEGRITEDANNIGIGDECLYNLVTGYNNIALGSQAGVNLIEGHNNIYIGNNGTLDDNSQIRIGSQFSKGCHIYGIKPGCDTDECVMINPKTARLSYIPKDTLCAKLEEQFEQRWHMMETRISFLEAENKMLRDQIEKIN